MKTHKILVVLFLVKTFLINAQEVSIRKADESYDRFAYVNAIKTYEKVAKKGYKSVELFKKLGNSYYFQSNFDEANKWYSELFNMKQDVEPEYYFRYAQTLKSSGNYKEADQMMKEFYQKSNTDSRGRIAKSQKDYLTKIENNSGRYTIENAGINTAFSDYGASFHDGALVFTSARDTSIVNGRKNSWDNQSYTNLYVAKEFSDNKLGAPEKFSKAISSKYHEATAVFTKDGNTMYFTRNNYLNGKKGKDKNKTILLKLYKATRVENKWDNIVELPFNSNDYSVAHPALSPDEKTLYFASNMPGCIGGEQSDIFKVTINDDGSYGIPENLGSQINTEGKETFPFIANDNQLYFSSDGHPGLGGLDVFVSQINENGSLGEVKNIGKPVNSGMDDFAFYIDSNTKKGFVSSNRKDDNLGFDDIYKLVEKEPIKKDCKKSVSGIVLDSEIQNPIENARVILSDMLDNKIVEQLTDANGKYNFGTIDCDLKIKVRVEKKEYNTNEFIPNPKTSTEDIASKILLDLIEKPIKVGDDVRKALGIDIIYFDLNKSDIRPDAAVELAKIVEVMKEHSTMKIDVRSHTDCRQTAKYNEALSDKRAKATITWLIKNGIAAERLTGKGYGETQLLNDCSCEPSSDSNCSEEEHQKNRRSEFVITKI